MPEVLLVSKPVAPPWNDSSKNLVRDLALGMMRYDPVVLARPGATITPPRGRVEEVYGERAGAFAPALGDHARVLRRLLFGRRPALWHFFFAPNPRTSAVGRLARGLRRVPTVQTVCSAPREDLAPARLLFADRTVVLSQHTERRLLEAGVPRRQLARIPASIEPLGAPDALGRAADRRSFDLPADAPVVCFPGDLEFGGGAEVVLEALAALGDTEAILVMACRVKTSRACGVEATLRARAGALGLARRVRWVGETPRIHALLAAADLVALPSASLYAKMDHPLVLLEAMSLERPVLVSTGTPAEELVSGGALAVPPDPAAVAEALGRLLPDDEERRRLGRLGREYVRAHHGRGAMARAYEVLYDEVISEAG